MNASVFGDGSRGAPVSQLTDMAAAGEVGEITQINYEKGSGALDNCGVLRRRRAVRSNRSTETAPGGQHQRRRRGSVGQQLNFKALIIN